MNAGFSLHVGVNTTDHQAYGEVRYSPLRCCEHDADAMHDLAMRNGFTALGVLLSERATFDAVESGLRMAAGRVSDGDTFMFTYSGHGAQLLRGDAAIDGGYDEGLVLNDGIMKDDYINTLLRLFPENTNIIFVCDACHSRTMFEYTRNDRNHPRTKIPDAIGVQQHAPRYKLLDPNAVEGHRARNRAVYFDRDERFAAERREYLAAQVVVLGACQDNQIAVEAEKYGLFTEALLKVLGENAGRIDLTYKVLIDAVAAVTAPTQDPSYVPLGPDPSSPFFEAPPFTIFKAMS